MKILHISTPLSKEQISTLKAGDRVLLSGTIYTARDAAHKRMLQAIEQGRALPFDLRGQIIYYAGPAPAKPGEIIGSCGPTTSGRMDAYASTFMKLGLSGMIGKGERSEEVCQAIQEHGCVYFAAIGGAGALIARCVKKKELIAYEDLMSEAIYKLDVEDFPLIVVLDSHGDNLYILGPLQYKGIE